MASLLLFPDQDALLLALASGAVPPDVIASPVDAAFGPVGEVVVRIQQAMPRPARDALRRLGVLPAKAGDFRSRAVERLCCWPQLLPMRREPAAEAPGPTTPVVFLLPGDRLPGLAGEMLRLGNDRQGVRWLDSGDAGGMAGGGPLALLRVVGPPYYSLLRAIDAEREGDAAGPVAFVERAPRVLVQLGYAHSMADRLRPPAGSVLLLRPPRRWTTLDDRPFRDLYEVVDLRVPEAEDRLRDVEHHARLAVPLRLARAAEDRPAEFWVLRAGAEAQLDDLVRSSDDRLIGRLAFAVTEGEGDRGPRVVIRIRPSKLPTPVLVFGDAVAYRPYLRLTNLFLPVGARLQPPLRRDAVGRLLAPDPSRVVWLSPGEGGAFSPESLPEAAFRPLDRWVDYVIDRDHRALEAWVQSSRFDFEPFACGDDEPDDDPRSRRGRRPEGPSEGDRVEDSSAQPSARTKRSEKTPSGVIEALPTPRAMEPDEVERLLADAEARFLAIDGPPDAEGRRPLWAELAGLNARLGRGADASVCWANAVWEEERPDAARVSAWAGDEARASGLVIESEAELDRALALPRPTAAQARALATAILREATGDGAVPGLSGKLDRVQVALERLEPALPVRVAWLAWWSCSRLAGGDALALARARDRLLERLHRNGLARDLDLPTFLRVAGGGSGDRARSGLDNLKRLRNVARDWAAKGPWVGPHTVALADLMFAFGLARVGGVEEAQAVVRGGVADLPQSDPVVGWLGRAFRARVASAAEGAPDGPLPADLMKALDRMGQVGTTDQRRDEKINRYKIDRLREHSRILEPLEKVDPYRHWHGGRDDAIAAELAAVVDLRDRGELAARMAKLLDRPPASARTPAHAARIVRTALEVAYRLGEEFARGLLDRVGPAVDGLDHAARRAELLERALVLAAHFDQIGHVRGFAARLESLLTASDERSAPALEPLLGQCFKGLRKFGLRDEADRLLDRMADLILRGRARPTAEGLASLADRTGPGAVPWGRTLRLLLQVAAGWSHNNQADRALPVFDEARSLLLAGDLPPIEQTALACGYVRALAQAAPEVAIPRVDELFRRLDRVHDTFTVGSHYSLSRLDFIEAVVLTLASEDFTLGESGRRWLEDDEFAVRRRIHRDVRAALGQEG